MILKSNRVPQKSVALRCHQQALAWHHISVFGLHTAYHRRTLDFQVVQFVHRRGVKAFGVSSCLSLSLICRENIGSFGVKHVIALWTPRAGKCIKLPGFGRFVKKEGTPQFVDKALRVPIPHFVQESGSTIQLEACPVC